MKPYTKADFAAAIGKIARTAVMVQCDLANGMWSPALCADDATHLAVSVYEDLQAKLDDIKRRIDAAASFTSHEVSTNKGGSE